jgi:anti-anti-sigma factor
MISLHKRNSNKLVKFDVECLRWPMADRVGDHLLTVADAPDTNNVVLDFGDVEFVTGSGLGKLVALHLKIKAKGGRLAFQNVRPFVREVFAVTGLSRLFDVRLPGL